MGISSLLLFALILPSDIHSQEPCNVDPTSGRFVTIQKYNSSSGWKSLTNSAAGVTYIKVNAVQTGGTTGNMLHVLKNWNPNAIASAAVDGNTFIPIPQGTSNSLQFYIAHATGQEYSAEITICSGDGSSSPTSTPAAAPVLVTPQPVAQLTSAPVAPPNSPTATSQPVCNDDPASGASLFVDTWNGSSGWKALTNSASNVCAIQISVLDNGTTNNRFHLLNNWNSNAIVSENVDSGTVSVDVPSGTVGSLQYFVEHTGGSTYEANVKLCSSCNSGTPAPTPPPAPIAGPPTPPSYSNGDCSESEHSNLSVPQTYHPSEMGCTLSWAFGDWETKSQIGNDEFSNSGEDCRHLHDRYFVVADDGKAYHTWHPPVVEGCIFQHEHGDDPLSSNAFEYGGGYPPFAYVANKYADRNEDHFGHKVVVANDVKMAIGPSQNVGDTIHDAGFTCNWFSKLHQGSYSADAFSNNLHEYFLTLQCNDTQFNSNTEFSTKALIEWGEANTWVLFENGENRFTDVEVMGVSELRFPWNNQPDLITNTAQTVGEPGGQREMDGLPGLMYKSWASPSIIAQPELWSGANDDSRKIRTPSGGSISFAPYYIVKNPARFAKRNPADQNKFVVKNTVEWCYEEGGGRPRVETPFCQILPETYQGPDYYKSPESPFTGTVRAVNFKVIELMNLNGDAEFCTDVFGKNPSYLPCAEDEVTQKANKVNNYWGRQTRNPNTGEVIDPQYCIKDVYGECQEKHVGGSLERWTFGYSNGVWESERVGALPSNTGNSYLGPGIGFEWIVNHGNAEGVRVPN